MSTDQELPWYPDTNQPASQASMAPACLPHSYMSLNQGRPCPAKGDNIPYSDTKPQQADPRSVIPPEAPKVIDCQMVLMALCL